MLLKNKTKGNSIYFENLLRTTQPKEFVEAIIDRKYDGTEEWSVDDDYEFIETPDVESDVEENYEM